MEIFQKDEIVEIPVSELQALYNSSVALFNDILDIAREERLLNKKNSAELLINAQNTINNEKIAYPEAYFTQCLYKKGFQAHQRCH